LRSAALEKFLRQGSWTQLWIVLHRLEYAQRNMPRLLKLQQRFAGNLKILVSAGEGQRAEDCFVLADAQHVVRRPVAEQSRGTLRLNDPSESTLLRERFESILAGAQPGIEPSVSGL
jgi:N-acyl-L-homoserine lactone synthetase